MTGQDVSNGVWMTGSFTGSSWKILSMNLETNNVYKYTTIMNPGDSGAYYFMYDDVWGKRETVPLECAPWWSSDRGYKIGDKDTTYSFLWGSCAGIGEYTGLHDTKIIQNNQISIYPNPGDNFVNLSIKSVENKTFIEILDNTGRICLKSNLNRLTTGLDISSLPPGLYFIKCSTSEKSYFEKLIVK